MSHIRAGAAGVASHIAALSTGIEGRGRMRGNGGRAAPSEISRFRKAWPRFTRSNPVLMDRLHRDVKIIQ